MYAAVALLALAASATAFAPTAMPRVSRTVQGAAMSKALPFLTQPKNLDGSMAGCVCQGAARPPARPLPRTHPHPRPCSDAGFDPLGLSEIQGLPFDLYWMREAELKHARVAMLAVVGFIGQEKGLILPSMPNTAGQDQVDGFWSVWDTNPTMIVAALVFIGTFELISGVAATQGAASGLRAPGDFGFNPVSFKPSARMAEREIQNGRLAMFGAVGMFVQGITTHESALSNLDLGF